MPVPDSELPKPDLSFMKKEFTFVQFLEKFKDEVIKLEGSLPEVDKPKIKKYKDALQKLHAGVIDFEKIYNQRFGTVAVANKYGGKSDAQKKFEANMETIEKLPEDSDQRKKKEEEYRAQYLRDLPDDSIWKGLYLIDGARSLKTDDLASPSIEKGNDVDEKFAKLYCDFFEGLVQNDKKLNKKEGFLSVGLVSSKFKKETIQKATNAVRMRLEDARKTKGSSLNTAVFQQSEPKELPLPQDALTPQSSPSASLIEESSAAIKKPEAGKEATKMGIVSEPSINVAAIQSLFSETQSLISEGIDNVNKAMNAPQTQTSGVLARSWNAGYAALSYVGSTATGLISGGYDRLTSLFGGGSTQEKNTAAELEAKKRQEMEEKARVEAEAKRNADRQGYNDAKTKIEALQTQYQAFNRVAIEMIEKNKDLSNFETAKDLGAAYESVNRAINDIPKPSKYFDIEVAKVNADKIYSHFNLPETYALKNTNPILEDLKNLSTVRSDDINSAHALKLLVAQQQFSKISENCKSIQVQNPQEEIVRTALQKESNRMMDVLANKLEIGMNNLNKMNEAQREAQRFKIEENEKILKELEKLKEYQPELGEKIQKINEKTLSFKKEFAQVKARSTAVNTAIKSYAQSPNMIMDIYSKLQSRDNKKLQSKRLKERKNDIEFLQNIIKTVSENEALNSNQKANIINGAINYLDDNVKEHKWTFGVKLFKEVLHSVSEDLKKKEAEYDPQKNANVQELQTKQQMEIEFRNFVQKNQEQFKDNPHTKKINAQAHVSKAEKKQSGWSPFFKQKKQTANKLTATSPSLAASTVPDKPPAQGPIKTKNKM